MKLTETEYLLLGIIVICNPGEEGAYLPAYLPMYLHFLFQKSTAYPPREKR